MDALAGRAQLPWEDPAQSPALEAMKGLKRSVLACLSRDPAKRPTSDLLLRRCAPPAYAHALTNGVRASGGASQAEFDAPVSGPCCEHVCVVRLSGTCSCVFLIKYHLRPAAAPVRSGRCPWCQDMGACHRPPLGASLHSQMRRCCCSTQLVSWGAGGSTCCRRSTAGSAHRTQTPLAYSRSACITTQPVSAH